MHGAIEVQAIFTAVDLGIFEAFENERGPEEVAEELSLHLPGLNVFLEILRVLGFVSEKEGRYQNTPRTSELFMPGSFANLLPFLEAMRFGLLERLGMFSESVKSGPACTMAEIPASMANAKNMAEAGACWAFRGVAQALALELAKLPRAQSFKRMLDLGGGHGVFSLYAAEALPELQVDVLDAPGPLEIAAKYARKWKLRDRVRTLAGDYVRGELEKGYDLVLASCTLNFTLQGGETLLVVKKVYEALNPGGYFVSLHDALPDSDRNGRSAREDARYPLECLASELLGGIRMAMPHGFIAQTMLQSGFMQVHSREFPTPGGLFSLDVARKCLSA